jgi:ABC-type branched-subunit amino acid transport system ATPase component
MYKAIELNAQQLTAALEVTDRSPHLMAVEGLSAGYGKHLVLHDVSLRFANRRLTAILGPNGSGKSTLLKSIFGLTDVFSGSIQIQGRELVGLPTEVINRHGLAYVPQRHNIFTAMTVHENLLLAARRLDKTQASEATDEALALFPILAKRRNQKAGQLSGGERQMVAIAIGWLSRPRVMLLDEPTAGLSPIAAADVFKTLQVLLDQGLTVVVVEQNARRLLKWADDVLVLREGRLAFEGAKAAFLADEKTMYACLGVGARKKAIVI